MCPGKFAQGVKPSLDVHHQYDGIMTNLNIFTDSADLDLRAMSAQPCSLTGSYLAWADMRLSLTGLARELTIPVSEVCGGVEEETSIVLPVPLEFSEANQTCHLINGNISEFRGVEDIAKVERHEKQKECSYFWTPYSGWLRLERGTFLIF